MHSACQSQPNIMSAFLMIQSTSGHMMSESAARISPSFSDHMLGKQAPHNIFTQVETYHFIPLAKQFSFNATNQFHRHTSCFVRFPCSYFTSCSLVVVLKVMLAKWTISPREKVPPMSFQGHVFPFPITGALSHKSPTGGIP